MEFIDIPSTFRDKSVQSAVPNYYKYNKPIRSAIFKFNKVVSDIDIETCTPVYPAAGHVITGNLKIISDSRISLIIAKGPKYRFPTKINFQKCREKIAVPLNEYWNRWCKREHVECDVLNIGN